MDIHNVLLNTTSQCGIPNVHMLKVIWKVTGAGYLLNIGLTEGNINRKEQKRVLEIIFLESQSEVTHHYL